MKEVAMVLEGIQASSQKDNGNVQQDYEEVKHETHERTEITECWDVVSTSTGHNKAHPKTSKVRHQGQSQTTALVDAFRATLEEVVEADLLVSALHHLGYPLAKSDFTPESSGRNIISFF
ncbi:hypothetical protein Q3G72_019119 [Acer saccharum]|nr:hypothetical protein Q3G72_019119 [Acer saccharum]